MYSNNFGYKALAAGTLYILGMFFCAWAQADWATDMFQDTSHNFGTVARGSDTQFQFVFKNKFVEDVVIDSVRSSCRCTTPTYQKKVIKTWEQGVISIRLDTRNFSGRKDATVTVRFSRPFFAEVQLHSYCSIRSDVSIQPGAVSYGTVPAGAVQTKNFIVDYAGGSYWRNWRIVDIQSEASCFSASLRELNRQPGSVRYEIALTLKENAQPGYLKEFINLITNDPNPDSRHCPVPISGLIEPSITIKPSPLSFGIVDSAVPAVKTVVLAGQKAFIVTGFQSSDPQVAATVPTDAKTVHLIPLTFRSRGQEGKFTGNVSFSVNTQPAPVSLSFSGEVIRSAKQEESEIEETTTSSPTTLDRPQEITPAQRFFPPKKESAAGSSNPEEAPAGAFPQKQTPAKAKAAQSKVSPLTNAVIPEIPASLDAPALDDSVDSSNSAVKPADAASDGESDSAVPLEIQPESLAAPEPSDATNPGSTETSSAVPANAASANANQGKTPLFQKMPKRAVKSNGAIPLRSDNPAASNSDALPELPGIPVPPQDADSNADSDADGQEAEAEAEAKPEPITEDESASLDLALPLASPE